MEWAADLEEGLQAADVVPAAGRGGDRLYLFVKFLVLRPAGRNFGYAFVKGGVPIAPFIIGFILGPMAEMNLRRDLQPSGSNFFGFLTNPISGVFLAIAVLSIVWQVFRPAVE